MTNGKSCPTAASLGIKFGDPAAGLDLLYILGKGSQWEDNELRYSLRSVEECLPHARVFIVGEYPTWLRGVHHIDAADRYETPLANSIHKVERAVRAVPTLHRWAIMNDDFFFLHRFEKLPLYHRGTLRDAINEHPTKKNYYFDGLCWARAVLQRHGIAEPMNYGLHFPMVFERERVEAVLQLFGGSGSSYHFRTMYGNIHRLGGEFVPQVRGRCPLKLTKWENPEGAPFFSTDNKVVLKPEARTFFAERYPFPSRYEMPGTLSSTP